MILLYEQLNIKENVVISVKSDKFSSLHMNVCYYCRKLKHRYIVSNQNTGS